MDTEGLSTIVQVCGLSTSLVFLKLLFDVVWMNIIIMQLTVST